MAEPCTIGSASSPTGTRALPASLLPGSGTGPRSRSTLLRLAGGPEHSQSLVTCRRAGVTGPRPIRRFRVRHVAAFRPSFSRSGPRETSTARIRWLQGPPALGSAGAACNLNGCHLRVTWDMASPRPPQSGSDSDRTQARSVQGSSSTRSGWRGLGQLAPHGSSVVQPSGCWLTGRNSRQAPVRGADSL